MTTHVTAPNSSSQPISAEWSSERSTWRRLGRVVWLQHRAGCLSFLVVFAVLVAAILIEGVRAHSAYAAFVSAGCVSVHFRTTATCNGDALALSGGAEFKAIGVALIGLPLLVGVFLGAPLVAREVESGTVGFAWTQGVSRSRLVLTTLGFLCAGVALMGLLLGLLYGGWYAHLYEVALAPIYDQWQATLFATTWWLLPLWMVLGLAVGTLSGAQIRRVVPAMAASAAVVGGLIVGTYLLLPDLLGVGAAVRRLAAPIGVMANGTIHAPTQSGWPFPSGSWVVRSWLTGRGGHVLGIQAVQHAAYELSLRTPAGGARWLALHHVAFWVSYQPPGHFWAVQAVEGVIVLALAALVVTTTLRLLRRRVGA
jgi:hypothetical protein